MSCKRCGGTERYKNGKCRTCSRKSYSKWVASHPGVENLFSRKRHRKDWQPGEHHKAELALNAASSCEICSSKDPRTKKGWQADHNHSSGRFRGILCFPCNIAVSHVERYGLDRGHQVQAYLEER